MKKFTSMTLIFLCLFSNSIKASPQAPTNVFKEGVYNPTDITSSLNDLQYVENVSMDEDAYFIVLDENKTVVQTIKLEPKSKKYTLHELTPNYKIIIVGNGSVFFS